MEKELRENLIKHTKKYGTTLQFIATKIKIHRSTLSLFKNNKRGLAKPVQIRLKNYLDSFN